MRRVAVIGDYIKDVYVEGSVRGISAETPTMVMQEEKTLTYDGGAGLVSNHVKKLSEIGGIQFSVEPVVTKTRFFVDGYKLFQVDKFHNSRPFDVDEVKDFIDTFADALIVADNRHGRINVKVANAIVEHCSQKNIPLFVDSQMSQEKSNHSWYTCAETVLLNQKENDAIGFSGISEYSLKQKQKHYGWKNVVVKLGAEGSVALIGDEYIRTPGVKVNAVDTCGAGDAFLAALATREKLDAEALQFANEYAAQTCTYIGTGIRWENSI